MTEERRVGRTLTDSDVEAVVQGVADMYDCKPCPLDMDKAKEAIKFVENINAWFDGTKRTIWNTMLVAVVLGVLGLIMLGVWAKAGVK